MEQQNCYLYGETERFKNHLKSYKIIWFPILRLLGYIMLLELFHKDYTLNLNLTMFILKPLECLKTCPDFQNNGYHFAP